MKHASKALAVEGPPRRRLASPRLIAAFWCLLVLACTTLALSAFKAELVGSSTADVAGTGTWTARGAVDAAVWQGQESSYGLEVDVRDAQADLAYAVVVRTTSSETAASGEHAVQDVRFRLYRRADDGSLGEAIADEPSAVRSGEFVFADEAMVVGVPSSTRVDSYVLKFLPNESGRLSFDIDVDVKQVK